MKILLVEDSERLQRSITAGLKSFNHAVDQAFDGQQGLDFARAYAYDVIVLDLMLPVVDGLTVLRTLRSEGNSAYVLILSARDQIEDRIAGLDLGADDYLVKPFSFDELVSRIRALFRRRFDNKTAAIRLDELTIDSIRHEASFAGVLIPLTPTEYTLLEVLARYQGQVFSHQQLIDRLYPAIAEVSKNSIEVHVSALRRKLTEAGAPPLLKTRRGFGYFLEK